MDLESVIGPSERYIHSEIYKRFSGVNSAVHSHSSDVVPYSVNGVPLKPVIHTAGFLGKLSYSNFMLFEVTLALVAGLPIATFPQ